MLELPPPPDLGLPDRFTSWRPQQIEAIDQTLTGNTVFVGQGLPVGAGKSLAGVAQIHLSDSRGIILTATKSLQSQYMRDFESMGAADIRGRASYTCTGFPGVSCEDGRHLKCPAARTNRCPHHAAVIAAQQAPIVITNYTCYITNHIEQVDPWGEFDMLILDEAHASPFELAGCLSIDFTGSELDNILRSKLPVDTPDDWIAFAGMHADKLQRQVEADERRLDPRNHTHLRRVIATKRLLGKLRRVQSLCSRGEWVVEVAGDRHVLEVLWPAPYAAEMMFRAIPKTVLMSATLTRKTCDLLGILSADLDYREYSSPFKPDDNRVYILRDAPRMDRNSVSEQNLRLWVDIIDQIIDGRLDRRGIIHSVSYARARDIVRLSRYGDYMITHESHNINERVAMYRNAQPPAILVSPSVSTGWDFPASECAYQIISKLPFPDSRNLITKLRSAEDATYAPYLTAQKIEQSCGRGKRLDSDRCENFIIDGHAGWFYRKYRHLFSNAFRNLVRTVSDVPNAIRL